MADPDRTLPCCVLDDNFKPMLQRPVWLVCDPLDQIVGFQVQRLVNGLSGCLLHQAAGLEIEETDKVWLLRTTYRTREFLDSNGNPNIFKDVMPLWELSALPTQVSPAIGMLFVALGSLDSNGNGLPSLGTTSTFGEYNQTLTKPRLMQFALRYSF